MAGAACHSSISKWKKDDVNAYNAARRNGWHHEATAHMTPRHQKWANEEIFTEAKKYKSRSQWASESSKSYGAAGRRGIRERACEHMGEKNQTGVWTKSSVLRESKRFKTKRDWLNQSRNSYAAAKYHEWFEEATGHMRALGSRHKRCIYKIEVLGTNLVYIGLSFDAEKRLKEHLRSNRFIALVSKYGLEAIKLTKLTEYLNREEVADLEVKFIAEHKSLGYELLNKNKGGVLGGSDELIWTKAAVFDDALNYSSKSEWAEKSSGAFDAARRMGVYEEAVSHMPEFSRKWTREALLEEALKFETLAKWTKQNPSAVARARSNGFFDEVTAHMTKRKSWSKSELLADAQKYQSRTEWKKNSPSGYQAARRKHYLDEATNHMIRTKRANGSWDRDSVLAEAKKYQTKTAWKEESAGSYYAALRRGWFEEASSHLPKRVSKS